MPMRVRSPQIVFLLLLLCSVQLRQDYAVQLGTRAVAGKAQVRSTAASSAPPVAIYAAEPVALQVALRLTPASLAVHRTAWTMAAPALDAAALASYTGFLRA